MIDYDFQLKRGELKVKVTAIETWNVKAIRSDNGKEDSFPIMYFKENFKEI
jgi:hypothetical protein